MSELLVRSNAETISVVFPAVRGAASADAWPWRGFWWVSRVVVRDDRARGTGAGSRMLRALTGEFARIAPESFLLVAPGGYEGDYPRQRRFYEKNGFVAAPSEFGEDALVWRAR